MSEMLTYEGEAPVFGPIRSNEAEMGVLGAAMLLNDPATFLARMEPEDFYRPAHRHLFRAMKALASEGKPLDPITLQGRLRDLDLLEQVGGVDYLTEIETFVPSVHGREAYAGEVLDKWARRDLLAGFAEAEAAIRGNRSLAEVRQIVLGFETTMGRARPTPPEPTWSQLVRAQDEDEDLGGVPTGNGELDSILEFGGLTNGQITLVMAGSGKGKTTWGVGAVFAALDRGERCSILTFADNGTKDFVRRALRYKCGVPDRRSAEAQARLLRDGMYFAEADSLMERFLDAQEEVDRWDLEIYDVAEDDENGTYEQARAWLVRKVAEGLARTKVTATSFSEPDPKPMSLALWDYAQEINVGAPELLRLKFYYQQAWVARNMARLCKKLGFPFIVPVQFTKGDGGKEEVAECKVWEKVCENWLRIQPHGVEIRKRRRGGDTSFVARHAHDDERWCFVPNVPSKGTRL